MRTLNKGADLINMKIANMQIFVEASYVEGGQNLRN